MPIANAVIGNSFPEKNRGMALGISWYDIWRW